MSKNSFLVNIKENLKRRKGIAVLYSVLFLLVYPIGLTLFVVSTNEYMKQNPDYRNYLTESFAVYLGMNIITALFVTLLAVICAIQGFSYVFKRQKLDLYLSVPVSEARRFAVIYVNGILIYALPYLVSILISTCIGIGSGIYLGKIIKTLIFSYLSYLIYYLAIYNIAIIVVMVTGNTLVALCGVGVCLLYEGVVRLILSGMCSIYFETYSSYTDASLYHMSFSPALFFVGKCVGAMEGQNVPYLLEKFGFVLVKTAAVALITGIAAYLLYAVRPAENCNKTIVFKKARPFIKTAVLIPLSLMSGILFYSVANSAAMTVLGFFLGILLCHGILEVIFEIDLKAMFRSFGSTIVSAVLVFIIFAVFKFDLTGYDRWVPKPEQVESAAVSSYQLSYGAGYDLNKGNYTRFDTYMLEHMRITDMDSFCAFIKSAAESGNLKEKEKNSMDGSGDDLLGLTVKYRMKNGKEKYRRLLIPYEMCKEELNRLLSSEEYQKGAFQFLDEEFNKMASLEQISLSGGIIEQEVEKEDMEQLLQAYKEDLKHCYNMDTVAEQYPLGMIEFEFSIDFAPEIDLYDQREQIMNYRMPIYENFENTMAYAKEKNLLEDWRQSIDDIKLITINHFSKEYGEWINRDFTKQEEIEAILPALIPGELANFRIIETDENSDYSAYVSYREKKTDRDYEAIYFMVEADLLPDFTK